MDRLLTPKQLSEKLQVGSSTIYKWVHYQYVPYIRVGDLIRFREQRIDKWLLSKETRGRSKIRLNVDKIF